MYLYFGNLDLDIELVICIVIFNYLVQQAYHRLNQKGGIVFMAPHVRILAGNIKHL
jgi:hypothetical protein